MLSTHRTRELISGYASAPEAVLRRAFTLSLSLSLSAPTLKVSGSRPKTRADRFAPIRERVDR